MGMECADLSGIPVAVTADHPLTWESMKDFQWHVKDFLGCLSLDRVRSSQLRRYRKQMERTMMKGARTMREMKGARTMREVRARAWTWTV